MGTLSCLVDPPCTPESLTVCRTRSSLPPRGSTPSGSVAPSWLRSPPSSPCGSQRRGTTSPVPPSSTGSASRVLSNFSVRSAFGPEPVLNDKKNSARENKHLPMFREKKKKKKKKHPVKKNPPQCFVKKKKKKKKKKVLALIPLL